MTKRAITRLCFGMCFSLEAIREIIQPFQEIHVSVSFYFVHCNLYFRSFRQQIPLLTSDSATTKISTCNEGSVEVCGQSEKCFSASQSLCEKSCKWNGTVYSRPQGWSFVSLSRELHSAFLYEKEPNVWHDCQKISPTNLGQCQWGLQGRI